MMNEKLTVHLIYNIKWVKKQHYGHKSRFKRLADATPCLLQEQKCTFKNRTYEMLTGTAVQIDYKKWRLWNNQNTAYSYLNPMYKPTVNIFINKWQRGTQIASLFDSDLKLLCSKLHNPGETGKNSPAWLVCLFHSLVRSDSSGFNPKYACSTPERQLVKCTVRASTSFMPPLLAART